MATDTTAAVPAASGDITRDDEYVPRRRRIAVVLPLVLLVIAAVLRFWGVGYPERIYFDETYYAPQGRELLTAGVEEGFAVHPSVGKWLIAGGIRIFGYDTFGFRAASAAAGSVLVLATYFVGLRLFRRRGLAALAAFFVAIDGLALTMSRIAMLDVFLALFVTIGVWLLLKDRDAQWADLPAEQSPHRPLPRRGHAWRWAAGVAFGLALATKWSALLALAGAGVFVAASELLWRRRLTGSPWPKWWRGALSAALTLLVVPLLVYVVSYAGWFANFESTRLGLDECAGDGCDLSPPELVSRWWGEQVAIFEFHKTLEAEHPYRSEAITWPLLARPVAYYYESCTDEKLLEDKCVTEQGNVEEILGIGNPAIWWLALPALGVLLWFGLRRRDWVALTLLLFYVVQYVPWLFAPRPNFLFYLTPAVPMICLILAYAAARVSTGPFTRWIPAAVAALAVAAFIFWFPVWTGAELPLHEWRLRMWFGSWI